jgi:PQQ-dependent catabolism-associated beta-propeller protein
MQAPMRLAAALLLGVLGIHPASAQADTVFVTNELDDTVSVVDGEALKVVDTIAVGRRPRGIEASPDGRRIYVALGDDDRFDVIDVASRKVVDTLPSGPDPERFAVSPDGARLYVANENDNVVTMLDIAAKKIVGEAQVGIEPEGMAVSPDGKTLVCTSETTSMAHFIDPQTGELGDNILVDTRPRVARFTPDARQVWVSSELRGSLTVLDSTSHDTVRRIDFAAPGVPQELIQAVGIMITRDHKRAFVALGPSARVAEVDAQTYKVLHYHLVGQRVWNLAFSPDERRLYTTNGNSNDISVLDLDADRVVKSLGVGRAPWGVVAVP